MLKFINLKKLTIIEIIIIIVILGCVVCRIMMYSKSMENFEDEIDKDADKYDDALDKRIAEVKKESLRYDAESLISENKPYQQDKNDGKGWWAEVIEGSVIPIIYSRPKDTWIWPY